MEKINRVLQFLDKLAIDYELFRHPSLPTIELALEHWKGIPGTHCKNIFLRNHKGDKHYLVIFECHQELNIRSLEILLKQGKLSFASAERMEKHLGLSPGSVSPFGLINDCNHHVKLFIDNNLEKAESLSFHPNDNTATITIKTTDFIKYLNYCKNDFQFIQLY